MVDKNVPKYVFQKDGTFYFSRHVPLDLRHYYSRSRIVICLKTRNRSLAFWSSKSISTKLDDYWIKLRLTEISVPASHLLIKGSSPESIDMITLLLPGSQRSRFFSGENPAI